MDGENYVFCGHLELRDKHSLYIISCLKTAVFQEMINLFLFKEEIKNYI